MSKFYTKYTGLTKNFRVKVRHCNPRLLHTFLESLGSIECCYTFGLPWTLGSLPLLSLKHAVPCLPVQPCLGPAEGHLGILLPDEFFQEFRFDEGVGVFGLDVSVQGLDGPGVEDLLALLAAHVGHQIALVDYGVEHLVIQPILELQAALVTLGSSLIELKVSGLMQGLSLTAKTFLTS